MDNSTIIPIIASFIFLWVLSAAVNRFAARRKEKLGETGVKETPGGNVSPVPGLLRTISTPVFLFSQAWGKLGFAVMESNCLLFTIITALPLLALAIALTGGALLAPGQVYAAFNGGNITTGLPWLVIWLFCLAGVPGLLSGIKAAYRSESRGFLRREKRRPWLYRLLVLAGIGILLIPVSSRMFPGFLSGADPALKSGARVNLTAGDTTERAGQARPAAGSKAVGKNLLKNGDFEQLRGDMLLGWKTDFYGSDKESVRFSAVRAAPFRVTITSPSRMRKPMTANSYSG